MKKPVTTSLKKRLIPHGIRQMCVQAHPPSSLPAEIKPHQLGLLLTAAFAVLMALLLNALPAQAAKTTPPQYTLEMGVANSLHISDIDWLEENPKASYTYASSNKNIVTVSKKGVIKSIKTGTTEITVKQTLNKKTTTVCTITVKVKNAYLSNDYKETENLTNQPGYFRSTYNTNFACCVMPEITCQNPKAVYKVYSSDESKLSVDTKGFVKNTNGTGTVKLTVKETYNKKTRTVGTHRITLRTPSLAAEGTEKTIAIGESLRTSAFLSYGAGYAVFTSETPEATDIEEVNATVNTGNPDDGVLAFVIDNDGKWAEALQGTGSGTRYLHYYMYDYTKQKYTRLLGTMKVNVIEVPDASSIQMEFEKETDYYRYNPADGVTVPFLSKRTYDVFAEPYNYSGAVEAISSDESVVKIIFKKSDTFSSNYNRIGTLYVTTLNPGTATVTVKAGGAQTSFKITVVSETFRTHDNYCVGAYFTYDGDVSADDITFTSSDASIATVTTTKSNAVGNEYSSNVLPDCKYLEYWIYTGTSLPDGAKSVPVTITAYCKGMEIFSVTLEISD